MSDATPFLDTAFWITTGFIALLLLLSGFFSGSETALTAASRGKLRAQADKGNNGAKCALEVTEDTERLIGAVLLKERIGWATLGNILFIGPWTDLFLFLIPSLKGNLWLQIAALALAVILSGVATAVYISVDAGAGPRDSLMLAVSRVTGRSVQLSRAVIEILVVIGGWLLHGPVGIGTLVFALFIGSLVQFFFKLFHAGPQYSPQES